MAHDYLETSFISLTCSFILHQPSDLPILMSSSTRWNKSLPWQGNSVFTLKTCLMVVWQQGSLTKGLEANIAFILLLCKISGGKKRMKGGKEGRSRVWGRETSLEFWGVREEQVKSSSIPATPHIILTYFNTSASSPGHLLFQLPD